jgi:septal ring factor EnvC (AmiA/AmiB activator)
MSDENCCGACGYPIHATKDKACDWCRQTADRIDALTAENERLERVVKDISDEADLAEQEACMVEDDIIKAEKEIEALTAERDMATEGWAEATRLIDVARQQYGAEKSRAEAAEAKLAKAVEALREIAGECGCSTARAIIAEIEAEKT